MARLFGKVLRPDTRNRRTQGEHLFTIFFYSNFFFAEGRGNHAVKLKSPNVYLGARDMRTVVSCIRDLANASGSSARLFRWFYYIKCIRKFLLCATLLMDGRTNWKKQLNKSTLAVRGISPDGEVESALRCVCAKMCHNCGCCSTAHYRPFNRSYHLNCLGHCSDETFRPFAQG